MIRNNVFFYTVVKVRQQHGLTKPENVKPVITRRLHMEDIEKKQSSLSLRYFTHLNLYQLRAGMFKDITVSGNSLHLSSKSPEHIQPNNTT